MTIATQADVEALLLRPLTAAELVHLAKLLARADGIIAEELPGLVFTGVQSAQSVTLIGNGTFEVWLPGRPVVSVASVTVDGVLLDPLLGEYSWRWLGDLAAGDGRVWEQGSQIAVVYTFGLAAPPASIVNVAAELVKFSLLSPGGSVRQESIGQYSTTYADPAVALNASHRRTFDHFRYPVNI